MTDDNVRQLPTGKNIEPNYWKQQSEDVWEEIMEAENKIEELEEQISLVELIGSAPSGPAISDACDEIKRLLLEKNIAYGNSALSPIQIFAKAGAQEGIANRIDDKLNRIKNNQSYVGDNDLDDLIGYLILYKISQSS
jgi:hypothetical protein